MGDVSSLLVAYLLGGVTFIPLVVISLLIHAHLTFPTHSSSSSSSTPSSTLDPSSETLLRHGDTSDAIKSSTKGIDERFHAPAQDADVAAGYFAVCREYVPGGVNGKPPERTTPAGESTTVIAAPSQSVYQSMYRSIFERKKEGPLDHKGAGRQGGRRTGGNVFYVVLRHSHLLLFDDAEMLEVRYVLSLAHHDISIYGGGEHIPDGELFIKRNALCLTRKADAGEMTADGATSKPFFLFTENTSDKEDFYFAMLKNQERKSDALNNPPIPLQFDVKDMITLVQRLHSSEEHLQTRWINAMLGRIFLGLYKTPEVETFIRAKITKKISRVKKPSFLSGIILRDIYMGEGAPFITNPRLKDLTVDGDCVVEADVRYTGNFRLEIAATARIDLGTRFKAREVNLLLAVVLKKVEGHVFVRIKPPPSNRVWMTFSQPPKVEMTIEPIVSSRQITYTVILRQIENRIKEVIAESIVMPHWDDITFYPTEGKKWRGGVWVDDTPVAAPHDLETTVAEFGDVDEVEHMESEGSQATIPLPEKSMSVPNLETTPPPTAYPRKTARSLFNLSNTKAMASSSSVDTAKPVASEKPRAIRHGSFASASSPIVGMDITNIDAVKASTPPDDSHASSAMAAISALSHPSSPSETPVGSPSRQSGFKNRDSQSSVSSNEHVFHEELNSQLNHTTDPESGSGSEFYPSSTASINIADSSQPSDDVNSLDNASLDQDLTSPSAKPINIPESSHDSSFTKAFLNQSRRQDSISSSTRSATGSENPSTPPKRMTLTAVASAAASARRWGLNALQRNGDHSKDGSFDRDDAHSPLNQPMGRGRPLPPPGTPLPPPDRKTPTAPMPAPKRKSLAPPVLPKRPQSDETHGDASAISSGGASGALSNSLSSSTSKEDLTANPQPDHGTSTSGRVPADQAAPPLPKRRPTSHQNGTLGPARGRFGDEDIPDDGIFVVPAPALDSEPTTPRIEAKTAYLAPWVTDEVDEDGGGDGTRAKGE